jgi:transposase
MAYSIDFRKAAIEYWRKGHSKEELYEAFKIHPSRVYTWLRHEAETGSLKPSYRETRNRKINLEELRQAVERKPDAYLSELAKQFDCTEQAIFYGLKRLDITVKKSSFHTPSNHPQT